jgi:hypothetical protein
VRTIYEKYKQSKVKERNDKKKNRVVRLTECPKGTRLCA